AILRSGLSSSATSIRRLSALSLKLFHHPLSAAGSAAVKTEPFALLQPDGPVSVGVYLSPPLMQLESKNVAKIKDARFIISNPNLFELYVFRLMPMPFCGTI